VGDHVLVDWRGSEYPAVIVGVEGPAKLRVHFDGYSDDWDETITSARVKARLSATAGALPARGVPVKTVAVTPQEPVVGASGTASTSARAPSSLNSLAPMYHVGDRVRVEWHGSIYPATILDTAGDDRYRIHYEGYGNEWDETIGPQRIQRKNN
jgi:hypothetical protein